MAMNGITKNNSKLTIDTHNRVSAGELEEILTTEIKAIHENAELAKKMPPLMVWGAPGLGKSTIISEVARKLGIGFIDVRLSQREPVDMRGLPVPNRDEKSVEWYTSAEWPRDPNSKGIILFDEITAADRSLQVAAYEFILDRRLGKLYTVPDGWFICAAGNRTEDHAVAMTMSSALSNRFMHVELEDDIESWVPWAVANDVHPSVIGFLQYRPGLLLHQKDENLERGWPSPRSWERVSTVIKNFNMDAKSPLLRKLVYGLVGDRAGVEFMAFHTINANFDDVLSTMLHPEREIVIPKEADRKYAMCSAMVYLLWKGKTEEETNARIDGFLRICLELPSDFATMAVMNAMVGCDEDKRKNGAYAQSIFKNSRYREWADKHGKSLKRRMNIGEFH